MRSVISIISLGFASLLSACSTTAQTPPQPAVIVASEASLRALTQAVSTALNGRTVHIAPDSLTKRPTLIMDPVFHRGPDGNPIMGRNVERPDHFRLEKHGRSCILVHEETGKELALKGVACVPTDA